MDATSALRFDGPNFLAVQVDNSFRDDMLPRNNSYDWAQDGGLTRPVSLLVMPRVFIHHLGVQAVPDLDSGQTSVDVSAWVRWSGMPVWSGIPVRTVTLSYSIVEEGSGVALTTVQKAAEVGAALPTWPRRDSLPSTCR